MFLTKDEIVTLTGFRHKAKQCEQLRKQGVAFRTNVRGEPIVCKTVIEGSTDKKNKVDKAPWQPNLSA